MKNKTRLIVLISSIILTIGLIAGGIWYFYRSQAAGSCSTVTVYTAANYSGTSACLGTGSYTMGILVDKGIGNDRISSISMPTGMKVTVYRDDNFRDQSTSFTQSVSNLQQVPRYDGWSWGTWNDQISSLKVVYTSCPAPTTETRTQTCPAGQTGSKTETRTRGSVPDCVWGNWHEASNTCTTPPPPPPPPPPRPAPSVNLKVNNSNGPITVEYDAKVKLSWDSSDTDSCSASKGWTGPISTNGEETSYQLGTKTTFVITCSGNGSSSDSVTVNVNPASAPDSESPPNSEPNSEPDPNQEPVPQTLAPQTEEPAQDSGPLEPSNQTIQPPDNSTDPTIGSSEENPDLTTPGATQIIQDSNNGQATATKQTTPKNNVWAYIIIFLIAAIGAFYYFVRFRNRGTIQKESVDMPTESEAQPRPSPELEPDSAEPPLEEELPPAPKPTNQLSPNIPTEATLPGQQPNDMDID